jgi:ABC transporter substrate binding protein
MRRRQFITLLGGAAAWPLVARAQQPERMRRIGVLMYLAADDPDSPARVAAFAQGLQELGWIDGRNIRIDYRWGAGDTERYRAYAAELVALAPDVILVSSGSALAAVQNATRTVPIVFVNVGDPVGAGYVASLARPGGNTTGFTLWEWGISGKWRELLKEIVPAMTRAAVIRTGRNRSVTSGGGCKRGATSSRCLAGQRRRPDSRPQMPCEGARHSLPVLAPFRLRSSASRRTVDASCISMRGGDARNLLAFLAPFGLRSPASFSRRAMNARSSAVVGAPLRGARGARAGGSDRRVSILAKRLCAVMSHVGSRVRMRRKMLAMSQQKLADALGLTFQRCRNTRMAPTAWGPAGCSKCPISFRCQ